MKKIYIIGIWWIGISAIARYYNTKWYQVFGSDAVNSKLIEDLIGEWIDIFIWEQPNFIDTSFEKVIYTESISKNNPEYLKAIDLWIETISYPKAVWQVANDTFLIAISGTHGKSTTTSMTSILLKNSKLNFTSIVWTLLKEFDGKNFFHRKTNNSNDDIFLLEACEYKRSFLNYEPNILAITNIEPDHLDYYKDENDYISAYRQIIDNVKKWWFVILSGQEDNSRQFLWGRQDINYIVINDNNFLHNWQEKNFPKIELNFPWEHILYDAKIVYIIWHILDIKEDIILKSLENYRGAWRRFEEIWYTKNNNLVISDYAHHPTEIIKTLKSIKDKYKDKYLLTIFQPHQYSRTIELIDSFVTSFNHTDKLIISDIYNSRDKKEDIENMTPEKFVNLIKHKNKQDWKWLKNTLKIINEFDNTNNHSIIILMWAGNVDNLRYEIEIIKK